MLMDWESWWEWERLAVETLADVAVTAEDALARLDRAVERVRPWRPSEGQLVERVRLAFAPSAPAPSRGSFSVDWLRGLCQIAIDAVPSDLRGSIPDIHRRDATLPEPSILKRYLAAHAFANWTAHLGRGLRSWLRSVEVAYALVRCGGDVRGADLILRHLADPARLAAGCSRSDEPGASNRAVDPV